MLFPPSDLANISHSMPTFYKVFESLSSMGNRYSVIWRDIIISVSSDIENDVYKYLSSQQDIIFNNSNNQLSLNSDGSFIVKQFIKSTCLLPVAAIKALRKILLMVRKKN